MASSATHPTSALNPYDNPQGPGDARPTADEIVEKFGANAKRELYKDKVVMITGASSGIGVETARTFAKLGWIVYLPVRDQTKGAAVVKDIESSLGPESAGQNKIHLLPLDLNSLQSVRNCVKEFLASSSKLNILICNAGVMATPEGRTVDGFETQFGSNHLAHFLLAKLLTPTLIASSSPSLASRVITLTSSGHGMSPVLFGDYDLKKRGYQRWIAYGQSKTANIYMATEIERRYGNQGVHALAVHPGSISTGLQLHMQADPLTPEDLQVLGFTKEGLEARANRRQSVQQGAATTIWAAFNPEFEKKAGFFCEQCSIGEPKPADKQRMGQAETGYTAYAYDEESAKRLWEDSERMIQEATTNQ